MPDPNNQSGNQPITEGQAPAEQTPGQNPPAPSPAPVAEPDKKDDDQQASKPDQDKDGETITVSKKEWNKLNAKKRVSVKPARPTDPSSAFSRQRPAADDAPTEEELSLEDRKEFVTVKEGIVDLLSDNPKYQEVLKKDPTLKRIIKNNPLALLDAQPYDAQDAIEMITNILDERAEELEEKPAKKPDTPASPDPKPAPQPAPQAAGNMPAPKGNDGPKSMGEVRTGLLDRIMGEKK